MVLTARDREIIEAVYYHRFLTTSQIQRLFFRSKSTAQYRLVRLYQHRYLDRIFPPVSRGEGSSQAVYCLDKEGAHEVASLLGVDRGKVRWTRSHNRVKALFLSHTLQISEFWVAVHQASKVRADQELEVWRGEKEIRDRVSHEGTKRGYLPFTPDAYFLYRAGERRAHFFLEVDLGTETNARFGQKVRSYIGYRRAGRFRERYDAPAFRMLTVTTSQVRLRNLLAVTERVGGERMFWFTTLEHLTPEEVLGPIWRIPGQDRLASLVPS